MKRVFLFKVNGTEDRDCVNYIYSEPMRFECGHYFGGVNLTGACFSMGLGNIKEYDYSEITTVLTQEEIEELIEFDKSIDELGYGIAPGDERYKKGVELCENIQRIYDKLNGEENEELFKEVVQEEIEWLSEEYGGTEEEIKEAFSNYGLEYRDRGVFGVLYGDAEELGMEMAEQCGYVDTDIAKRYFDFKSFGEDIVEDGYYYEFSDGRVVSLNY